MNQKQHKQGITVGLLPLYIALYDKSLPERRPRIEAFAETIARELEARGFSVLRSPICRLSEEFSDSIHRFETEGADCIVTLHLAYSPSLESADALAATELPIVVLDVTETNAFGFYQDPAEIGFCHGIHGVMDMCNLLHKKGKPFAIAAGHYSESTVLDRSTELVHAAASARALRGMKVASIGGSFDGMGDFLISDEELKREFGVDVVYAEGDELRTHHNAVTEKEIEAEIALDMRMGSPIADFTHEAHARSTRDCLALRRWLEDNGIGAFTVNFLKIGKSCGLDTMPFMEACKSMARGLGYAGEGDVLTAAFCGALRRGFRDTAFIEIFCPDWAGNRLLLSHMGEMNYGCVDGKLELTEMNFVYGDAENPVVGYGRYRAGNAVFANVYSDGKGYHLLLSPVTMENVPFDDRFTGKVRGWLKPSMPLPAFLEGISMAGATHHSLLVYDASVEALTFFGRLCGLSVEVLA